jgi:hypothetical protein
MTAAQAVEVDDENLEEEDDEALGLENPNRYCALDDGDDDDDVENASAPFGSSMKWDRQRTTTTKMNSAVAAVVSPPKGIDGLVLRRSPPISSAK